MWYMWISYTFLNLRPNQRLQVTRLPYHQLILQAIQALAMEGTGWIRIWASTHASRDISTHLTSKSSNSKRKKNVKNVINVNGLGQSRGAFKLQAFQSSLFRACTSWQHIAFVSPWHSWNRNSTRRNAAESVQRNEKLGAGAFLCHTGYMLSTVLRL